MFALFAFGSVGCQNASGPRTPIDGKQLYDRYCARCHGLDGGGVPEQPAANARLNDWAVMRQKSDQQVTGVIRAGKPPAMPGFGDEFTDAKLMVLTAYVRSLASAPSAASAQAAPSLDGQ